MDTDLRDGLTSLLLRKAIDATGLKQVQVIALVQKEMPDHGKFLRGALQAYLAGLNLPGPIVLHAMCRALKVRPDDLLPRK